MRLAHLHPSGISACSSRHRAWPSYCDVVAFEVAEIERDRPMWLYARRDRTTQPWDARSLAPMDSSARDELGAAFGIDLQRVQQWRERFHPATATGGPPAAHAGHSVAAQYDRMFRIAALNRQIEALGRRRGTPGDTGAPGEEPPDDMTARIRAQRASLIDVLRESGRTAGGQGPAPIRSTSPS